MDFAMYLFEPLGRTHCFKKWRFFKKIKNGVQAASEGIAAGRILNTNLRKAENSGEEL
jgi:hypothetical protein